MAVCHFRDGFDIGDVGVGIAECLRIDNLGVGLDGSLKCFEVVDVDNGVGDALSGKCVGNQVERSAVKVVGGNNVVALRKAAPEATASPATPPSRAATRSSNTPCVGLVRRP